MGSNVPWTPEGLAYYLATNPHILQQLSQMAGSAMDSQLPLQDLLGSPATAGLPPQPQSLSPMEQAIQAQGSAEPVAQHDPLANYETGLASLFGQQDAALKQLQQGSVLSPYWQSRMGRLSGVTDAISSYDKTRPGARKPQ